MRVLVIVVVIVPWESKANSSSSLTELQTGTELGKSNILGLSLILKLELHKQNTGAELC